MPPRDDQPPDALAAPAGPGAAASRCAMSSRCCAGDGRRARASKSCLPTASPGGGSPARSAAIAGSAYCARQASARRSIAAGRRAAGEVVVLLQAARAPSARLAASALPEGLEEAVVAREQEAAHAGLLVEQRRGELAAPRCRPG